MAVTPYGYSDPAVWWFFRNFTHQATRSDDSKDDHFNAYPSPWDLNTFNPY